MNPILAAYTRRQVMAGILKAGLGLIYFLLLGASFWLIKDQDVGDVMRRIVPFGIPPLLSVLSAAFLSIFVLTLEQTRVESLLFSIICLVFAGLNLDIFLLGIISDPATALTISRIDHFFLVLVQIGANLHLSYLVCGKKDRWWVVYLGYGVGAVMALLTPTQYYFSGINHFFWGFFAKKAILYDVMSFLWMAATIYCVTILYSAYRKSTDPHRRDMIKFLIIGFVSSAALSLTNTPAIYGYELYPLGTFIFISLFLLAYGLFKYNLRIALQQLRSILLKVGHVALVFAAGLIPKMLLPEKYQYLAFAAGILMVAVLYHPLYKLWDALLNLLIRRSDDLLQKKFYQLTYRLSGIHHVRAIHQEICDWLFTLFMNTRCATVFYSESDSAFTGWATWNNLHAFGFFKSSGSIPEGDIPLTIPAAHPLVRRILSEKASLVTRAMLEKWIAENRISSDSDDWLQQAGMVIGVFSKNQLICLVIIGNKINDRSYTRPEKEIFRNFGITMGPFVENAKLLEGLELLVEKRTRDLSAALFDVRRKNDKIIENNTIIKKQNRIFLSLFETSTQIHAIGEIGTLFEYTLNKLRSIFPRLGIGILLEGGRSEILESGAFQGLSDEEQRAVLKNRQHLEDADIGTRLNAETLAETDANSHWTVLPMRLKDRRAIGKMIIKGPPLDPITLKVISIFLAQVSSATQNKLLMRRLETIASTDGLTGVSNRSFFDQEYEKTLKNALQFPDVHFSILIIDINGLKRVNDRYGHDRGDEMIRQVADLLKSVCRETDVLSRIGGDEFALLLPGIRSHQAEAMIGRIREKEKNLRIQGFTKQQKQEEFFIRISIGVSGSDETHPENVIKLADQRMYEDKEAFYQHPVEGLYAEHN